MNRLEARVTRLEDETLSGVVYISRMFPESRKDAIKARFPDGVPKNTKFRFSNVMCFGDAYDTEPGDINIISNVRRVLDSPI